MRLPSKAGLRKSGRGALRKTHAEIEVKLRIHDGTQLLRRLARLKAKLTRARVHEMNTLYDTPPGKLARHGQMLRIRLERPAPRDGGAGRTGKAAKEKLEISAFLTFKGPAKVRRASQRDLYKVREEHELRISDPREMPEILEAVGLQPWFRYEKFRSTFELPGMRGLKLVLDETPIGLFMELEGKRREINRAAGLLGFRASDFINKSYGALFMEQCGRTCRGPYNEPAPSSGLPDMLFRPSK